MTLEEYERKKQEILYEKSKGVVKSQDNCISYERCAKCKGDCCKHFPCAFAPEEFLNLQDKDYIRSLLETGLIIISPRKKHILYIRPRGIYDPPRMVTNLVTEPNPCALLRENGCILDHSFRPIGGLLTLPFCECEEYYEPKRITKDWSEYANYMNLLAKQCDNMYIERKNITGEDVEKYKRLLLQL